ncbi:MAG: putative toxin-antitoxin system toxin component, PIN family [Clostridia bacterium]|nr:putative toxin-antitoxin system toxin component, PIN family [Clostridia bacterium]
MKYYYAVIDTNVLVSAMLKWNSVPGNVMELVFRGTIIPVFNEDIIKEYITVLLRPKFRFTKEIVDDVISAIKGNGVWVDEKSIDIDLPDPKDRVFYEVVMEKRSGTDAYLVTGNIKHFPAKPFIVTPRQMLDIILDGQ